jgi:heme exporter protein A
LSMSAKPAIRVQGLHKSFGGRPVIRDLSLTLWAGDIAAIVGHNGSGKTTLMRLLAGLMRPTAGAIWIHDVQQKPDAVAVRRAVGIVSHNTFLYPNLTAAENLRFYGRLYEVDKLEERIEVMLEQFGLAGYRDALAGTLSRGTQQRLSLARAFLPNPPIVLLDEPDSGLDPNGIDMLPGLLALADLSERAVLLTTHNLDLGLALAKRIAILARGRLVWERETTGLTKAELREAYDTHLPKPRSVHLAARARKV